MKSLWAVWNRTELDNGMNGFDKFFIRSNGGNGSGSNDLTQEQAGTLVLITGGLIYDSAISM